MRRPQLVLIVVLAIALSACAKQDPEVSANDQVPANMRVAEDTSSDTEGEGGGEAGGAIADADAVWVANAQLQYTEVPASVPADGAALGLLIDGGQPHDVVFEGFEGDRILVEGAGAGEYVDDAAIPAGSYTFYCSIPGHRAAGMEGEVTVE